jgi:hypothetical protein
MGRIHKRVVVGPIQPIEFAWGIEPKRSIPKALGGEQYPALKRFEFASLPCGDAFQGMFTIKELTRSVDLVEVDADGDGQFGISGPAADGLVEVGIPFSADRGPSTKGRSKLEFNFLWHALFSDAGVVTVMPPLIALSRNLAPGGQMKRENKVN